jgi:leucyl/phenylalanyl-tRNA--protein transferase
VQTHQDQIIQGLLAAYRQGYFPMAEPSFGPHAPLLWLSPDVRGVIPLTEEEGFHVSRRLRDRMRKEPFELTTDTAFRRVIEGCARPRWYEKETWIDSRILELYTLLHLRGHAHSVEAWLERDGGRLLVGGLYGVRIGAAFFAESKFCRPDLGGTDASKIVLVTLVEHLRKRGFKLLDVQMWNDHLDQFGCQEVPRKEYLRRLEPAVAGSASWLPFEP